MNERPLTGRSPKFKRCYWYSMIAGQALEKIGGLDSVMPSQWNQSSRQTGETGLLTSLLASAADDIASRRRDWVENVETWLTEPETEATAPVTFQFLCRHLQTNEQYARSRLLKRIVEARSLGLLTPLELRQLRAKKRREAREAKRQKEANGEHRASGIAG